MLSQRLSTRRFVAAETRRLLLSPTTLVVTALYAAYASYAVVAWSDTDCGTAAQAAGFGGLSCTSQTTAGFLLPVVAVLVGGTAAASERGRGGEVLLAVRGIRGARYAMARVWAGSIAAAVAVSAAASAAVIAGLVAHPWRQPALLAPGVTSKIDFEVGGISPWLWAQAPLASDVLAILALALGAAAVAALGTAIGMAVRTPIVPIALIVLAFIAATWVIPYPFSVALAPDSIWSFGPRSSIARDVSVALRPVAYLLFPLLLLVGSTVAARKLAARPSA